MTGTNILNRFRLQVVDDTTLSSEEELALLNEVYADVYNDRDWEWVKKQKTDTTSISVPYVVLPTDFKKLSVNNYNESVIFVGTDYSPYTVIPYSSRRDYRDQDGFCYLDMVNRRLYFTLQPTEVKSIEYDYVYIPTDLTISTEPIKTETQFGNMLAYGMAAKFNPIEQSEKEKSYRNENFIEYTRILNDYRLEDANIKFSI